jgi:hypothetical protein
MLASPLIGTVRLAERATTVPRVKSTAEAPSDTRRSGLALGVAATGVVLTSAALIAVSRLDRDRDR